MSYARWSDESDVYVYDDITHGLTCCGCHRSDGKCQHFGDDADGLQRHLVLVHCLDNVPTERIMAAVRADQARDRAAVSP